VSPGLAARTLSRAPVLRRLPVLKLLSVAEVALLARKHAMRLTPQERRRLMELVRIGRGRPSNLAERDRRELSALVAKMEPRELAGEAMDKLSPVKLPRRVVYGRRRGRS
jgi:hypothetical protein